MLVEPMVMTMYAAHIVQDEVTGVTYMDTVTASVGRVALRNHPPRGYCGRTSRGRFGRRLPLNAQFLTELP